MSQKTALEAKIKAAKRRRDEAQAKWLGLCSELRALNSELATIRKKKLFRHADRKVHIHIAARVLQGESLAALSVEVGCKSPGVLREVLSGLVSSTRGYEDWRPRLIENLQRAKASGWKQTAAYPWQSWDDFSPLCGRRPGRAFPAAFGGRAEPPKGR